MVIQGTIMGEVEKCNELGETNGLLFFKKLDFPPKSEHKEIKPGANYPILNKYLKKFYLKRVAVIFRGSGIIMFHLWVL